MIMLVLMEGLGCCSYLVRSFCFNLFECGIEFGEKPRIHMFFGFFSKEPAGLSK